MKHLHHSIDTREIVNERSAKGHKVKNISNAKNKKTNEPLNLFFVDLEPVENNKDIYL